MFSEGIHSLVDTGNQILLLWGLKQARKPASAEFPFGHGKEVYFWSFIVAMLIFALGGAASIYQGVQHLDHAEPLSNTFVNFIVLGLALVFELAALSIAVKELIKAGVIRGGCRRCATAKTLRFLWLSLKIQRRLWGFSSP